MKPFENLEDFFLMFRQNANSAVLYCNTHAFFLYKYLHIDFNSGYHVFGVKLERIGDQIVQDLSQSRFVRENTAIQVPG